ncbi:MAG: VOC family protein [Pyrinomonadaceae bacterium MAG19_C2-C3]|nr:VOC family protein [Pyrinomonadaceae bacterium MAG19_C2-C3]
MAEQQMPATGSFCWNELMASDSEACRKFYTELLGWTSHESEIGETNYTVFKSGDKMVGGMMQMTAECGAMPSHWMSYVAVDDVDELVARVESLGGKTCVPPSDIPTVGRFAVINDPSGATVSILKLATDAQPTEG